jgi:gp16 family phage-associated protein
MQGARTAHQAKVWLDEQGKSVQEFAREHAVDAATTYQVLSGRKKGLRGEAYRVAVLLGMKDVTASSVPKTTLQPTSNEQPAEPIDYIRTTPSD